MIIEVNSKNFEEEVLKAEKAVLVDFSATWCVYCKRLNPVIDRMEKEYGDKIKFVKIDIDEAEALAEKYNIEVIPTLVLFENGEVINSVVNPGSQAIIKSWLEENGVL